MGNDPLKTVQAEAEEKVRALRREAEANDAALQEAFMTRIRAYENAQQRAGYAKKRLDKERKKGENFRRQIQWKQTDIKKLRGLFNGKRRRQLENEIAELEIWAKAAEDQLPDLERQLAEAQAMVPGSSPDAPELTDERQLTYRCAKLYEQAGLYEKAAREYGRIRGYRDVDAILESDENIAPAANALLLAQLQKGNIVTFGRYRQNSAAPNPEPIEWIVLKNDGKTARLLSRHGLFTDCYNSFDMYEDGIGNLHGCESSTWEECSLRRRLNGEFLDTAFTTAERSKLATMKVLPDANPKYPSDPGKPTMDKVCILCGKELERYKKIEEVQSCLPTQLAEKTCKDRDVRGNCYWWLRTPGQMNYMAVRSDWPSNPWGIYANIRNVAVRPVIALQLAELAHER